MCKLGGQRVMSVCEGGFTECGARRRAFVLFWHADSAGCAWWNTEIIKNRSDGLGLTYHEREPSITYSMIQMPLNVYTQITLKPLSVTCVNRYPVKYIFLS
jgi:hypothetical protein